MPHEAVGTNGVVKVGPAVDRFLATVHGVATLTQSYYCESTETSFCCAGESHEECHSTTPRPDASLLSSCLKGYNVMKGVPRMMKMATRPGDLIGC
ncbi:unnamed protein product [Brassica napus]|uniref:(rape) hypothetical protein n=1 Tax=Brassica napus TaxID=3708 RepID=A0A816X479_BRANA|nr:unnamed protein product [Brassica napus]